MDGTIELPRAVMGLYKLAGEDTRPRTKFNMAIVEIGHLGAGEMYATANNGHTQAMVEWSTAYRGDIGRVAVPVGCFELVWRGLKKHQAKQKIHIAQGGGAADLYNGSRQASSALEELPSLRQVWQDISAFDQRSEVPPALAIGIHPGRMADLMRWFDDSLEVGEGPSSVQWKHGAYNRPIYLSCNRGRASLRAITMPVNLQA